MRPTSFLSLIALGIIGIILADFLTHPEGTKAASAGIVNIEKPAGNALLGYPS